MINWDEIKKIDNPLVPFLRMQSGNTYFVRLIGPPVTSYVHWGKDAKGDWRSVKYTQPHATNQYGGHTGPNGEDLHERRDYPAIVRYGQQNSGEIKIASFPKAIFKYFDDYNKIFLKHPWDVDGCYFRIDVEGTGRYTRYTVTPLIIEDLAQSDLDLIKQNGIPNVRRRIWPNGDASMQAFEEFVEDWMRIQV